jgi:hypothetical protein
VTKEGKLMRLLTIFNTLSESDQSLVIEFSESIVQKEEEKMKMIIGLGAELHKRGNNATRAMR